MEAPGPARLVPLFLLVALLPAFGAAAGILPGNYGCHGRVGVYRLGQATYKKPTANGRPSRPLAFGKR